MVPIKGRWTRFADEEDRIKYYRLWGLITTKAAVIHPVMVMDGIYGVPEPCDVVGYQGENWAVIELQDGYHAIYGEYLAEMQPSAHQRLPIQVRFTDVLENYAVLDIETTGFNRVEDRCIEIAVAVYRYGVKVDGLSMLINPEREIPRRITKMTGITQCDVEQCKPFREAWPLVLNFIGQRPIIGHNATQFDIPFLEAQSGAKLPNVIIDTLLMVREVFPDLPRHTLDYLNDVFDFGSHCAHRASNDVETTNALLWVCLAPEKYSAAAMRAVLDHRLKPAANPTANIANVHFPKKPVITVEPQNDVCCDNILYGKSIVFTGELSIDRAEAAQKAVNAGAKLRTSVSAKTDYLVVGKQDIMIVGLDGMSVKEEKARQLNIAGKAHIEIIDEDEFNALLTAKKSPTDVANADKCGDDHMEKWAFELLLPMIKEGLRRSNAGEDNVLLEKHNYFSSICYTKHDPFILNAPTVNTVAIHICIRKNKHYIGISNACMGEIPEKYRPYVLSKYKYENYTNFSLDPTEDGVLFFAELVSSALDELTYNQQKGFDCCSRYLECSAAKQCVHPNSALATSCAYRKSLRSGCVFYGKNRNID